MVEGGADESCRVDLRDPSTPGAGERRMLFDPGDRRCHGGVMGVLHDLPHFCSAERPQQRRRFNRGEDQVVPGDGMTGSSGLRLLGVS